MQVTIQVLAKAFLENGIKAPAGLEESWTELEASVTETTAAASNEMALVLANPAASEHPTKPTHKKRGSMWGSLGMGWLFGGSSSSSTAPKSNATVAVSNEAPAVEAEQSAPQS